jgi:hypothetical protein
VKTWNPWSHPLIICVTTSLVRFFACSSFVKKLSMASLISYSRSMQNYCR